MSYNKLECDYFNLYNQFFKIDRMISLIHGRNMELIKDFMLFYRQIIKKEKSIEILQEQKNKIAIKLSNYMNLFNISPYQIQYSCVFYKDHFNSFDMFYKAVAYYITFKQNLSNEQKKHLALYKIKETTQYYCQIQTEKIEQIYNDFNIDYKYYISKNSLNEFHKAMTYLCAIFLDTNNKVMIENSIKSAIKHLKNGALNSYKFIINDYFILYKNDANLTRKIFKIRDYEYLNIGNDKNIIENYLLENYKNICNEIINKLKEKNENNK